jgi:hypothetical protein
MPWTDLSYLTLYDSGGIPFRKAGYYMLTAFARFP